MNETNSSWLTASGISTGVYPDTPITITGNTSMGYINPSSKLIISNPDNMNRQVKVAVFEVSRNKDNKVVSSKLVKELWVEQKNGSSIELAVAKHLDKDFDPETTIVKEIYSVNF